MAADSKIEWCDATWNPWIGCTKVSPACDHCYVEAAYKRLRSQHHPDNGGDPAEFHAVKLAWEQYERERRDA